MPDTIYGTNGNDILTGGNGIDTIYGGDGDDIISGGNGVDNLFGDAGNDQLFGDNGADHLTGGADDDVLDGKAGFDTAYYSGNIGDYSFYSAAGYLHILHLGGAGADGHDQVTNVERLVFGDRVIEIGSGANAPVAGDDHVSIDEDTGTHNSGTASVLDNDFDFDGDALTVTGGTFTGTYGTLTLNADGTYSYTLFASAQGLAQGENVTDSFDYTVSDNDGSDTGALVFHIAGVNDAPVAVADTNSGDPVSESGVNPGNTPFPGDASAAGNVLANDTDVDNGDTKTVSAVNGSAGNVGAAVAGTYGSVTIASDGSYTYSLNNADPDTNALAQGTSVNDVFSYTVQDSNGATSTTTLTLTVTGTNDGPVANPNTASGTENQVLNINVLANDTDVDNGAVLTVTAASAPAGKGTASVVGNQVQFNPGTAFDHLAQGVTEVVVLNYTISDEHGATSSSTVSVTVTGTNDGPVANPDTRTTSENSGVVIDVLANDTDADDGALLIVTSASWPTGQGNVTIVENQIRFDPGDDFDYLGQGESAVVVINYSIEDEYGASSSSTVTVTVQGREDGSTSTGTEGDDTLTGTPGDDTINALGGDDTVFGLEGDDLIDGGSGNDILSGGDNNDIIVGGDGLDQLFGDAGDDVLDGGNNDDFLVGGDGDDQLSGQAGDDILSGDSGNDQLSGGDGKDSLHGGEGDDSLDGGAGDDSLAGGEGTDSLDGGDGNDFLFGGLGTTVMIGGGGNDTIRLNGRSFASTITTGTGSDTIEIAHANFGTAEITVTDFTPGAGGDKFRLSGDDGALLSLLSGWDESSNPFGSSGFLRLEQSGADTLLQWDADGGGDDWETLAVFENTTVGNFTDANFVPGYHPNGSAPAGQTITGTADGDTLTGTIGNDTINALGGDDSVNGGAGPDQINGGDGVDFLNGAAGDDVIDGGNNDDFLFGGNGNDQLSGQAGNDSLVGENGDDQLSGGDGDDILDGGDGDDSLDGGDGADALTDFSGVNSFVGGIGNDQIIAGSAGGIQTIGGGDGNDTIIHYFRDFASTITTGTGSDTIVLAFADQGTAALVITDFTAGAGGDMFQLAGSDGALLSLLSGWDGSSNPFGSSGFLRLQQSGADTLLQWDQNGTAGGADWQTLVVFQNTDAGDFTDANFVPSYDPDGSAPAGQTITGTAGDDSLTGTIGDDTINALGGNDFVSGQSGADVILGGDGADFLNGDADDDEVDGGNGDDQITGGEGNDQLLGQAGNDILFGESGNDQLSGGDGNDALDGGEGDNTLDGGNDDDFLSGGFGTDVLNGGAGNDRIRHDSRNFAGTITTGTGSDTIDLANADQGSEVVTVTDFTVGTSGDIVQLAGGDGSLLSLLSGWDGTTNPFGSGFLRLQQDGADTVLQWDPNGATGGATWETLIVFVNTDADDFTDANFVPGYDPNGDPPAGETITGTVDDDTLIGTAGDDTIDALAGNDVVFGQGGADLISGGSGFDTLIGEAGDDVIGGGSQDDVLYGGDGDDQLSGDAGNDILSGENGDDELSGGDGDDSLDGGDGADTMDGGIGSDYLVGGDGADVLTGGLDADAFAFQTSSQGPDEITDFLSGTDKLYISADGFGGGLSSGDTVELVFGSDPVVEGAGGQFLYDTDDGNLYWDADGTGGGAAILVATLSSLPSLEAADFVVL